MAKGLKIKSTAKKNATSQPSSTAATTSNSSSTTPTKGPTTPAGANTNTTNAQTQLSQAQTALQTAKNDVNQIFNDIFAKSNTFDKTRVSSAQDLFINMIGGQNDRGGEKIEAQNCGLNTMSVTSDSAEQQIDKAMSRTNKRIKNRLAQAGITSKQEQELMAKLANAQKALKAYVAAQQKLNVAEAQSTSITADTGIKDAANVANLDQSAVEYDSLFTAGHTGEATNNDGSTITIEIQGNRFSTKNYQPGADVSGFVDQVVDAVKRGHFKPNETITIDGPQEGVIKVLQQLAKSDISNPVKLGAYIQEQQKPTKMNKDSKRRLSKGHPLKGRMEHLRQRKEIKNLMTIMENRPSQLLAGKLDKNQRNSFILHNILKSTKGDEGNKTVKKCLRTIINNEYSSNKDIKDLAQLALSSEKFDDGLTKDDFTKHMNPQQKDAFEKHYNAQSNAQSNPSKQQPGQTAAQQQSTSQQNPTQTSSSSSTTQPPSIDVIEDQTVSRPMGKP